VITQTYRTLPAPATISVGGTSIATRNRSSITPQYNIAGALGSNEQIVLKCWQQQQGFARKQRATGRTTTNSCSSSAVTDPNYFCRATTTNQNVDNSHSHHHRTSKHRRKIIKHGINTGPPRLKYRRDTPSNGTVK